MDAERKRDRRAFLTESLRLTSRVPSPKCFLPEALVRFVTFYAYCCRKRKWVPDQAQEPPVIPKGRRNVPCGEAQPASPERLDADCSGNAKKL
ncbi:hypothetical protein MAE02_41210 [Microvirga aerophila]|uniref:Uncharacterized protein n=1 Tax=Microvirga aerophila TaxID=670291 RepID=A0A512BWW0_9HYPH|nr:hypothetical protein MAE02_41210 [Microvirga aerophila]